MAGATLLTLLDDIAALLDDVSVLSKVAIQKTTGVLGDDLALNAQQVAGVNADRELPVVGRVALGSAVNKAILVPAALAVSFVAPWAVLPLLMVGGIYLCYEGVEKLVHSMLHNQKKEHDELVEAINNPELDLVQFEKDKIKGAIRTDFVLSAEIIVITLGTLAGSAFLTQILVLVAIAIIMTIGVYGLVAIIVKLDDVGFWLLKNTKNNLRGRIARFNGRMLLASAPYLMRFLSIAGTVAMFLVGGGIIAHGIHPIQDQIHTIEESVAAVPAIGGILEVIVPMILEAVLGVVSGAIALVIMLGLERVFWRKAHHA